MAITIEFSPDTERKLLARATATGQDVDTLVREAVEEKLNSSTQLEPAGSRNLEQEFQERMALPVILAPAGAHHER